MNYIIIQYLLYLIQPKIHNMIINLILFFLLSTSIQSEIQNQEPKKLKYTNLSNKYIYEIISLKKREDERTFFTDVYVNIINKANSKVMYTIHRSGDEVGNLFEDTFNNSSSSRSYITGYNKSKMIVDGDFGDIIILDFNFDGKEDLAIKKDIGRECFYDFYIQKSEKEYMLDNFLSNENLGRFPRIDFVKKKMTYAGVIGAGGWWQSEYIYNQKTNKWSLIKNKNGVIR